MCSFIGTIKIPVVSGQIIYLKLCFGFQHILKEASGCVLKQYLHEYSESKTNVQPDRYTMSCDQIKRPVQPKWKKWICVMSLCWNLTYTYNKTAKCKRPELIYLFEHAASHDPWRLANLGNETNNTTREVLFSHQAYNSLRVNNKKGWTNKLKIDWQIKARDFPLLSVPILPTYRPPNACWQVGMSARAQTWKSDKWRMGSTSGCCVALLFFLRCADSPQKC